MDICGKSGAYLVGITGGIGSGKSVVSRILRLKGFQVYDCDTRASEIMCSSGEIKAWLRGNVGENVVSEEGIDRGAVADVIFRNASLRGELNRLVHGAVCRDVLSELASCGADVMFVESAILATSHLDEMCDAVWVVDAPENLRVARVMARNRVPADEVIRRIATQRGELEALDKNKTSLILNDGLHPLMPRIDALLAAFRKMSG